MRCVVIKIGSRVLTKSNGCLNEKIIESIAKDISIVTKKFDTKIVIVSSGAVSAGRSVISLSNFKLEKEAIEYDQAILKEQILASIGQPKVFSSWIKNLGTFKINCAQLLTTRSVFANRKDYLSIRSVTNNLLRMGIIPIFNENDVLSPEKLDFTDNDQQACMIAAMLSADKLIILSDIDGVYDKSPKNPEAKIVSIIENPLDCLNQVDKNSGSGKGGMKNKLLAADLATSLGIEMHIANGSSLGIISKIIAEKKVGTFFPAKKRKIKPLKSWLTTAAVSNGKIFVSTFLADILKRKQVASILFSGIDSFSGNFQKGNVVEVEDDSGNYLGKGLIRFSSNDLKRVLLKYKKMNNKEKSAIKTNSIIAIHYDYFVFAR